MLLAVIILFWQSIPHVIWSADGFANAVLLSVFAAGLGLIVISTFALDHFEFTGLRQLLSPCSDACATLAQGPRALRET